MAPAADRLEMCRLAAAGRPRLEISDVELRRAIRSRHAQRITSARIKRRTGSVPARLVPLACPTSLAWRGARDRDFESLLCCRLGYEPCIDSIRRRLIHGFEQAR